MRFRLEAADEFIPARPPPGGAPSRTAPTTQVMVTVDEWPGNVFRFWAPENVGTLWNNWTVDEAHQDFVRTGDGGLAWSFERESTASIDVEIVPSDNSLQLEARVTNLSVDDLSDVSCTSCLQLSTAPDFACGDFSRLYIRTDRKWRSLSELAPSTDYPHYPAVEAADTRIGWGGDLAHLFESVETDHPLMVCVSKNGHRSMGTAVPDFQYLFHNRANENLWCIHSQQAPFHSVSPGETAVFTQKVYFVNGGLTECVTAFDADPV